MAPSQTQLSTGDVINVSKQDEQGSKFALTACRIEDIEETPPAHLRDLQYPLRVINADLFVEYDTAGFVPKWLFDVMMLGNDVIFYGEADVVHRIGRDIQRLWRMDKDKDPTTVPFYHVRLPVYSWLSGPVTSSTYQFDEHCMSMGTTSRWDKQVYLLLSPLTMPLCARGLAHCCLRYSSLYITFTVAELCVVFRWTFRRDAEQEPWWFHASDSRAVVPDKYPLGSGYADAVVVVDDTPAMAAKIAMSDVRKWRFWLCQRSSKRTLGMPLEVLCSMQSSCCTCWRLTRRSREQQLQLGILKMSGFSVAFHCGFWTAIEGMKGTSRCMLQRPSGKMS